MLEIRLDSINIKPAMTYSRAGRTTIGPRCLSAVFGMGTGVSTWAWSPAISRWHRHSCLCPVVSRGAQAGMPVPPTNFDNEDDASSFQFDRAVASLPSDITGGGRDGAAKRSAVSTGPLSVSPHVHVRPIDPVVFREPSSFEGKPDLGGSFALICLQRLSVPHVATRRCG